MSDTEVLDKTFHFIMKRMVDTGQAPHYTEIATELGVSPEDGRKTMQTLFQSGIYGWLFPNTNFIASFVPSTINPPSSASAWKASRSGSRSELSNRWRSAGYFRVKKSASTPRVSIAVNRSPSKCVTALSKRPIRKD
jgi:hypothetical protein